MYLRATQPAKGRNGLTLVELLVAIVFVSVLVAIVLPKFVSSDVGGKEAALRADLKLLRTAIQKFREDTGVYPASLKDLASPKPPLIGMSPSGAKVAIKRTRWHGPYIDNVPVDPINGAPFRYTTAAGSVGKVSSSARGYEAW